METNLTIEGQTQILLEIKNKMGIILLQMNNSIKIKQNHLPNKLLKKYLELFMLHHLIFQMFPSKNLISIYFSNLILSCYLWKAKLEKILTIILKVIIMVTLKKIIHLKSNLVSQICFNPVILFHFHLNHKAIHKLKIFKGKSS